MAGKKKTTKKTAGKKAGKSVTALTTPDPSGPNVGTGSPLHTLGVYAVDHDTFRVEVAHRTIFRERFEKELATGSGLQKLSDDEIAFCQGWLYVAESEFTSDYDTQVKAAIEKHIASGGGYAPYSG